MNVRIETVHTGAFSMNYFRFGSGAKTLVILPGLSVQSVMGAADAVEAAYRPMEDAFTIYLFDRRNELPPSYSVRDMARDTAAAIKALGRSNFDDGLLEISMVRTPTNPIVLQQTINEILANRIGNDHFLVFSASNVKITSAEGVSWTLDGEAGGTHTEVSITCCKRAIKLMIRPDDKTDQQNETDRMRESLKISKSLLFEDQKGIEK